MTRKEFIKIADELARCEASLCAADVEGELATATHGSTEAVIVGAVQVIIDAAKRNEEPLRHLITASGLLHTVMLDIAKKERA